MQATITYMLTEQAQRAQMAATGQPVARKQVVTVEVTGPDLDLLAIAEDGTLSLDMSTAPVYGYPVIAIPTFGADPIALYRDRYAAIKADIAAKKTEQDARDAANQNAAIDRYLATGDERSLYTVNSNNPRQPEITVAREQFRALADANLAAAKLRDIEAAAKAAELESAKAAYIAQWIAENGEPEIQAQFADGLLCRKTAVALIASAAFAAAGVPEAFTRVDCCDSTDCPCSWKTIDCLPRATYPAWKRIATALPEGYTVEFSRYRECLRRESNDWDAGDETAGPKKYLAEIKIPHGPFTFERTIEL